MKKIKITFLFIIVIALLSSCKDDEVEGVVVEADNYTVIVDGTELVNNSEKIYNAIGAEGNMDLSIKNVSSATINLKMKVVSINGNYSGVEDSINFCIGNCYTLVIEGSSYPLNEIYSLEAGQTSQQDAIHIQNLDDRSGDLAFKLKLYQVDSSGDELTTKKVVNFTYKYVAP